MILEDRKFFYRSFTNYTRNLNFLFVKHAIKKNPFTKHVLFISKHTKKNIYKILTTSFDMQMMEKAILP